MDRIEKLKREQAEQLAALVESEKLRDWLPSSIRESARIVKQRDHWTVIGWTGFGGTQHPFGDAVNVIEEMQDQLLVAEHWKSGTTSCRPARINNNIKDPGAEMDGSHTIEIKVEGGRGFQTIEVRFWVELGGQLPGIGVETYLAEIQLPVTELWQLVPFVRASYNNSGDLATCEITWPIESRIVDSFRKWYSERPAYSGSYYLADWHNFNSWSHTMLAGAAAPPYNKGIGGGAKEKEASNVS